MPRLIVTKTPKVYVGGAFIRSESARTFPLRDAAGNFFANIPQCTRKDLRNAIEAAAKAGPGWAKRTPYNRGQIIYRLGEMLEARKADMLDALMIGAAATAPRMRGRTAGWTMASRFSLRVTSSSWAFCSATLFSAMARARLSRSRAS